MASKAASIRSTRLARFYRRYRDEVLAVVGLGIPVAGAWFWSRLNPAIAALLTEHWLAWLLGGTTVATALVALRLRRRLKGHRPLALFGSADDRRYRNVLERAHNVYYLLGMSAEEFQRYVPLAEFFRERADQDAPIRELRFLLLHPDSPHFSNRILDVNPGSDLKGLVERKKDLIRSLHLGLSALPPAIRPNFQIKFYDSYPIWVLQFFDQTPLVSTSAVPNAVVLCAHGRGTHSKFSPQYLLKERDSELFISFMTYFDKTWESALSINPDGSLPKVYQAAGDDIQLIIFDFDGTIVDSNDIKRQSFVKSFEDFDRDDLVDLVYRQNIGKPRRAIIEAAARALGSSENRVEVQGRAQRLDTLISEGMEKVALYAGFRDFMRLFASRYRFSIVSNAPESEILLFLQKNNLADAFDFVFGHPISKPDAVRNILKTLGISSTNVVYVGDTDEDRAVSESFGFRYYEHATQNLESHQSNQFRSYDELSWKLFELIADRHQASSG
jgi:phosphoglycolate phosphatase